MTEFTNDELFETFGKVCITLLKAVVNAAAIFTGVLLAMVVFAALVRFVYMPWEVSNVSKAVHEVTKSK